MPAEASATRAPSTTRVPDARGWLVIAAAVFAAWLVLRSMAIGLADDGASVAFARLIAPDAAATLAAEADVEAGDLVDVDNRLVCHCDCCLSCVVLLSNWIERVARAERLRNVYLTVISNADQSYTCSQSQSM